MSTAIHRLGGALRPLGHAVHHRQVEDHGSFRSLWTGVRRVTDNTTVARGTGRTLGGFLEPGARR